MNILALETTGKYGSAAVITDDGKIFSSSSSNEMNHLRDIIILSDEALKLAGITKRELTHIAASKGPGSFTGIRIGVTTARTAAQALGISCIGVSSLEALARRAAGYASESGAEYIAAIINARRHQTYAGVWKIERTEASGNDEAASEEAFCLKITPYLEERQYMIEELLELLRSGRNFPVFFTGDGIDAYESVIEGCLGDGEFMLAPEDIRYQDAAAVAAIAAEKAGACDVLGYDDLKPEYMRLSEAEQRLKEGTLSDKIRKLTGRSSSK